MIYSFLFCNKIAEEGDEMTDEQASAIRELRLKGEGYRVIASALGLSRDIVRNYCKSHGLSGYGNALVLNVKEQMDMGKVCLYCGKELSQAATGRRRKFCSDECRRKWWAEHPDRIKRSDSAYYELTCVHCGRTFLSYGNNNRKYCSHSCYVKDRFLSNPEEEEIGIQKTEEENE